MSIPEMKAYLERKMQTEKDDAKLFNILRKKRTMDLMKRDFLNKPPDASILYWKETEEMETQTGTVITVTDEKPPNCFKRLKTRTDTTIEDLNGNLTKCQAWFILFLNLLLPGIGTIYGLKFIQATTLLEKEKTLKDESMRIKSSYGQHVLVCKSRGRILGLL